jgi:hypothetical protein
MCFLFPTSALHVKPITLILTIQKLRVYYFITLSSPHMDRYVSVSLLGTTKCELIGRTNISEEHTALIIQAEGGESMFL